MHDSFMRLAMAEAEAALAEDEVPIGAVIVHDERVIAATITRASGSATHREHAEMIAITQAAESLGSWRLEGCAMYVTLEPCPMYAAGAMVQTACPGRGVRRGRSQGRGRAISLSIAHRSTAQPHLPGRARCAGLTVRRIAHSVFPGPATVGEEIARLFGHPESAGTHHVRFELENRGLAIG